jgi:hypothetical protein
MNRLEAITISLGSLFLVAALALIDWRLGLAAAGALLIVSAIDLPRRRP